MNEWLQYFIDLSYCEDIWKKSDAEEIDRYSDSPFLSRKVDWFQWLHAVRMTEDDTA